MKCQLCKNDIGEIVYGDGVVDHEEAYEYRGFVFHEKCFDEGAKKVDTKRHEVMEVTSASIQSQASGEWNNGGYKTMSTDVAGTPIVKNPKEPQILKDYENGIL